MATPPIERKWILIVDDDPSVRLMLSRVLNDEGYGVLTSINSANALELAATFSVDLILLDLNMKGADGWSVLQELKEKRLTPSVIIITAMPNQQAAARAAGVKFLLEKPLDFPHLVQTVSQVLNHSLNSTHPA
jgi:CheY-like chemotaxis protein